MIDQTEMSPRERIIKSLRSDRRGLTIDTLSSRTRLNRMTISTYLRELLAEQRIKIRVVGVTKLHFWDFKKEKEENKDKKPVIKSAFDDEDYEYV